MSTRRKKTKDLGPDEMAQKLYSGRFDGPKMPRWVAYYVGTPLAGLAALGLCAFLSDEPDFDSPTSDMRQQMVGSLNPGSPAPGASGGEGKPPTLYDPPLSDPAEDSSDSSTGSDAPDPQPKRLETVSQPVEGIMPLSPVSAAQSGLEGTVAAVSSTGQNRPVPHLQDRTPPNPDQTAEIRRFLTEFIEKLEQKTRSLQTQQRPASGNFIPHTTVSGVAAADLPQVNLSQSSYQGVIWPLSNAFRETAVHESWDGTLETALFALSEASKASFAPSVHSQVRRGVVSILESLVQANIITADESAHIMASIGRRVFPEYEVNDALQSLRALIRQDSPDYPAITRSLRSLARNPQLTSPRSNIYDLRDMVTELQARLTDRKDLDNAALLPMAHASTQLYEIVRILRSRKVSGINADTLLSVQRGLQSVYDPIIIEAFQGHASTAQK